MPKYPKINFLISTKFHIFQMCWLNLALFFESFQPKSVNMGFWVQISNLNQILPVRYFECADFRLEICFLWFLATGYTNQFNDFVLKRIWKTFFFAFCFGKVSKCYGLNCYFLKVLILNTTLKKSKHILKLTILSFEEIKWMRKQVLKSY